VTNAITTPWSLCTEEFSSGRAFDALRRMREDEPCPMTEFPGVRPAWNLVRHSDIVAALRQPDLYSSAVGGTTLRDQTPEEATYNTSLLHVDPPRHTKLRSQFQARFRPGALAPLQAAIDAIARELVTSACSDGHVDAVRDIAAPMAAYSLCAALGVPASMRDYFMRLSALMLADTTPDPAAVDYASLRLPAELLHVFGGSPSRAMMRLLRADSGERNWLVPADQDGDGHAPPEVQDLLVILSTAGTGMTQNCIVTGIRLLAENWARFSANPCGLLGNLALLAEEVIRLACPLYHVRRTVTADHELHGQLLRRGDKVLLWLYSGNMDESVYQDPGEFDPGRSPNPHLSFGRGGPHYCLGAALARMEVVGVLRALLEEVSALRVLGPPEMLASNFVRETSRLPIGIG